MSLPELLRRSAEKQLAEFCRERSAKEGTESRVVFRMTEDHATLFLENVTAKADGAGDLTPVARLRFDSMLNQWTLHYPAGENRWAFYLNAGPALDLGKLLYPLGQDPLHLFWPSPDYP